MSREQIKRSVYKMLTYKKDFTVRDVALRLGCSTPLVDSLVRELQQEGKLNFSVTGVTSTEDVLKKL